MNIFFYNNKSAFEMGKKRVKTCKKRVKKRLK